MNHFYDNVLLLRVYHRCNLVIWRYNTLTHIYAYLAFVANWDAFFLLLCRCLNTDVNTLKPHTTYFLILYRFWSFLCKALMMMIFCVLSVISSFRSYTLFEKAEPFIRKLSYVPAYTSYIVVIITICSSYMRWFSTFHYCIAVDIGKR